MNKLFISILIGLLSLSTTAAAQTKPYYTRAPCVPFQVSADLLAEYGETILLTGNLLTFPAQDNEPAIGRLVFSTNQETGTYSIIQLFADGMACLIGSGNAFEPYVD